MSKAVHVFGQPSGGWGGAASNTGCSHGPTNRASANLDGAQPRGLLLGDLDDGLPQLRKGPVAEGAVQLERVRLAESTVGPEGRRTGMPRGHREPAGDGMRTEPSGLACGQRSGDRDGRKAVDLGRKW